MRLADGLGGDGPAGDWVRGSERAVLTGGQKSSCRSTMSNAGLKTSFEAISCWYVSQRLWKTLVLSIDLLDRVVRSNGLIADVAARISISSCASNSEA